ncbi:MAG: ABC transporter permease [Polyangiaceae bacterium]|jgi:ABC-type transport system involved in multi-copper enzyme maturation permease subunit|nr:ABC transporter permease [Polyangiaceae bacterium]
MSTMLEIGLTASRELRRNLKSAKGLAMGALFLLGGTGGSLLYARFTRYALERLGQGKVIPPEALRDAKLSALKEVYQEATAQYLVDCPTVLLFLFRGTLLAIPLLTLLAGFDSISGETQHRTLRYFAARAERSSIVLGKTLGLWVTISGLVLLLHLAVWVLSLINDDGTAAQIASWGPRLWALSLACAACYAGITALFSALFRTPAVALFVGVAALAAMGVLGLILNFMEGAGQLAYLLPSKYDSLLLSHEPTRVLGAIGALLAWTTVTSLTASELVRRRDL